VKLVLAIILVSLTACQSHKVAFMYEYGDQAVGATRIESQSNKQQVGGVQ
jgi:hypothetical protein